MMNSLKKITAGTLILGLFASTAFPAHAQSTNNNAQTGGTQSTSQTSQTGSATTFGTVNANGQAAAYQGGAQNGGTTVSASGVATNLLGCSAGQLLGQLLSYGISKLLSSAIGAVTDTLTKVPTADSGQAITSIQDDTKIDTSARTGQTIMGVPIGASFDSIAWCIANSLIEYVADATIAWANSGFNGSPAFLENPESFFQDLADMEAQNFISSLAYNTAGFNICEPFRVELAIGLAENYGGKNGQKRFNRIASCSLDQMQTALLSSSVGVGGVSVGKGPAGTNPAYPQKNLKGYWSAWNSARYDRNNAWGSWIVANDFLYGQIEKKGNTARFELGLNNGWLNFSKCQDQEAAKKGDRASCKTYTPGSLIQTTLEQNLNIPKDRLVAVQKFDQVITAVVNNLIKVALNKALEQ